MNKLARHLLCGLGILIFTSNVFGATGIVTNKDGRSFEGELQMLPDGRLSLAVEAGDGSVAYSFQKDNLAGIEFLDAETVEEGFDSYEQDQYETAIGYLEKVHRNRSPFLKLAPTPLLIEPSLVLGDAYLKTKRYTDATGVAGVLLGIEFNDPRIHQQANEILLMSFFGLERWDETEILARRWCENHEPFDESALGWWILGEVHLARGEIEKARWVSLQPITFSSQYPKAYLQDCYHVAIATWIDENPDQALELYEDYQTRGYQWPDQKHSKTRNQLMTLAINRDTLDPTQAEEEPLTIEEGSPEKDLNLPLQKVRKLTTKTETNSSQ